MSFIVLYFPVFLSDELLVLFTKFIELTLVTGVRKFDVFDKRRRLEKSSRQNEERNGGFLQQQDIVIKGMEGRILVWLLQVKAIWN